MDNFVKMAQEKQFATLLDTMYATGGGAYKFEESFLSEVNIGLNKLDEMDCLVKGMCSYLNRFFFGQITVWWTTVVNF